MSKELDTIEKKLAALKASKEIEENKSKEAIEKLTKKYEEDSKNLKAIFDGKVNDNKKDLNEKLAKLNPEIKFFEDKKATCIKLEQQMKDLFGDVQDRMKGGKEE